MSEVVLVTGAANGIGAAVARRFARNGAKVVIADIVDGSAVASEIDGLYVRTDVSSEADNRAAVAAAVEAYGGLDVVHLNAGTGGGGALDDFDLTRFRRTFAVNVEGMMFGILAALPTMRPGGSIVVTSSLAGIAPNWFDPAYSASKHAIIGLVRSLATTLAESKITLNAICPGFVESLMFQAIRAEVVKHGLAIADPDEVAQAVEQIIAGGETGQAWIVQAGRAPELVTFPEFTLPQA
ncbi:SDR family NAD(P)-dependent oxidoreductase [Fodinicola acaciae]|uniref:SDR family NAD(P)-dependent oxidoreductase n=1 Tax=Fodinicola acaciae TaxID=2681555 RepID=UPI0013D71A8A|nr:SDR family oxidoreductase [Fodinicola acaciae]